MSDQNKSIEVTDEVSVAVENPSTEPNVSAPVVSEATTTPATDAATAVPSQDASERQERIKKLFDLDRAGKSETDLRPHIPFLIRTSNDDFDEYLQNASVNLIMALIEELAGTTNIRANIRKVGLAKKRFDIVIREEQKKIKEDEKEKQDSGLATDIIARRNHLQGLRGRFNTALDTFNRRKNELDIQEQRLKESNTEQKKKLLAELKEIVMSEDATAFDRVQKIQEDWRKIGQVVQESNEDIFQTYRTYVSQFYDMRNRYLEFAQQVRKINQQEKERLLQQLFEVLPAADADLNQVRWQDTSTKINSLFEQWKNVGAVPRAKSDELWAKFKEGLDRFYQLRRQFYNSMDKSRADNAQRKEQILTQLRIYSNFESTDLEAWRNATTEIQKLRDEYRTVGSAPQNKNKELRDEFLVTLRDFFERKKKFFNALEQDTSDLLKQKEALLQQAEELKDSEDWKETARKLQELQQEWRNLGADFTKDLRKLNKRFRKVCDTFFRRRAQITEQLRENEVKNLERKIAIIARIEAILADAEAANLKEEARALREEFDNLGPGPREQNRKANERFRNLFNKYVDKHFESGEKERARVQSRVASLRNQPDGQQRVNKEEKKFVKKLRSLEDKIQQYETNIQFISKGGKSDDFRKEIERKIEEAKRQKDALERRIKAMTEAKTPESRAKAEAALEELVNQTDTDE